MVEKSIFVQMMQYRTKSFAVEIIKFTETLKLSKATAVITYQ